MPQAQQLGRYLLLDRIAYGGMAEIFRAKTFDADGRVHLVAVKRVLSHLIEDDDFLQMIVDEAKISALLHHDNIAQLFEFAHAGGEYFLAMEYVDGRDLRSLIERIRQSGRKLPPEHAAWVAMETARALHAAHTQRDPQGRFLRIVHRDVSPSNVLLSYRGEVKLCDFGIAKATLTRIQTKTGVIKGKVKYMSPEQALGRKLDNRSDLFSLGTVMYEMLTLQPPFQAQTEVELIFAVRECRKRPITDHRRDLPVRLVEIIDRAMSRSRSGRYQSGQEMADELRAFLDDQAPGFRRAHFAQFMRQQFAEEIERDLRLLEDYVVQEADATQIGENLIADVLAPNAPFTRFTPCAPPSPTATTDVGSLISVDSDDLETGEPDVHGQKTVRLDRAKVGLLPEERRAATAPARPPALSELPTQLKQSVPGIHEEPTRIHGLAHSTEPVGRLAAEDLGAGRDQPSIHEEKTGEKELPEGTLPGEDFLVSESQLSAVLDLGDAGDDDEEEGGDPPALPDDLAPLDGIDGIDGIDDLEDVAGALDLDEGTDMGALFTDAGTTGDTGAARPAATLHEETTRILGVDEVALDFLRMQSNAVPVSSEPTLIKAVPKRPAARGAQPARRNEGGEEDTSVPLSDDDLEDLE